MSNICGLKLDAFLLSVLLHGGPGGGVDGQALAALECCIPDFRNIFQDRHTS